MVCLMSIDQTKKKSPIASSTAPADVFDSKSYLAQMTKAPGVYRLYAAKGEILYVGKAKNLKSRVLNYFLKKGHSVTTQSLVKKNTKIKIKQNVENIY